MFFFVLAVSGLSAFPPLFFPPLALGGGSCRFARRVVLLLRGGVVVLLRAGCPGLRRSHLSSSPRSRWGVGSVGWRSAALLRGGVAVLPRGGAGLPRVGGVLFLFRALPGHWRSRLSSSPRSRWGAGLPFAPAAVVRELSLYHSVGILLLTGISSSRLCQMRILFHSSHLLV